MTRFEVEDNEYTHMKYNFWHSVFKTIVRLFILGSPLLLALLPKTWMDLTLSGVLMLAFDKAKAIYLKL